LKAGREDGFKARIPIKREEEAIEHLVKKWNQMEITVDGETVKAKKAEMLAKKGRRRPNKII